MVLALPIVVLLEQDGSDQPEDRLFVGEDAHDISTSLHLLVQAFQWVGAVQLGPMQSGKGHASWNIGLALVHQNGQFRPAGAELVGDVPQDFHSSFLIGLVERLQDSGGTT